MFVFLQVAVWVCLLGGFASFVLVPALLATERAVNARVWGHRTAGELAMAAFVVAVLGFCGHMFWTQVLHF